MISDENSIYFILQSIPPDFVRHFNGTIPEKVYLIDNARKSWRVRLEETGGRVWLTKGWPCFKSDHHLNCGDFLIFKYDRSSSFEIKIFSVRGCRKEETFAICNTTPDVKFEHSKGEQNCSKRKHLEIGLEKYEAGGELYIYIQYLLFSANCLSSIFVLYNMKTQYIFRKLYTSISRFI